MIEKGKASRDPVGTRECYDGARNNYRDSVCFQCGRLADIGLVYVLYTNAASRRHPWQ
jgi:hypothetical protein